MIGLQRRAAGTTTTASSTTYTNQSKLSTSKSHPRQQQVRRRVRRSRRYASGCHHSNYYPIATSTITHWVVAAIMAVATVSLLWISWFIYDSSVLGYWYQPHYGRFLGGISSHHHRRHHHSRNEAEDEDNDDWDVLPWNTIYRVPEAMEILGDRSDEYAALREEIDKHILPPNAARSLQQVETLTQQYPTLGTIPQTTHHSDTFRQAYDIYNCPEHPPPGYPFEWKLVDEILNNWPASEVDNVPSKIHQGLCVFDYQTDYDKALAYRQAEVPFVVINDPAVARTVERWNLPGYLSAMTGATTKHRTEYNTNGHFLYSMPTASSRKKERLRKQKRRVAQRLRGDDARSNDSNEEEDEKLFVDSQGRPARAQRLDTKPQSTLRMTYDEWLEKANRTQHVDMEDEHYYFRLIGCGFMDPTGDCDQGSSEYLYDEMPYFQPHEDNRNELYLGNPSEQKGIHCRFGMKGVIAENHFDAGRNSIALLGGRRRYILSHPKQCKNLALFPHGHESARHSEVDYANPDVEKFPEFAHHALANEVVLEAGQVLYLPVYWFHYIVSLEINYQCNTRSGNTDHYNSEIHDCGFPTGGASKHHHH